MNLSPSEVFHVSAQSVAAEFIIFNTEFLHCNTEFLVFNPNFIIFTHHIVAGPGICCKTSITLNTESIILTVKFISFTHRRDCGTARRRTYQLTYKCKTR